MYVIHVYSLDMLNTYNGFIISIYKVFRNRSNYINNTYNIIMSYTFDD